MARFQDTKITLDIDTTEAVRRLLKIAHIVAKLEKRVVALEKQMDKLQ